MGRRRGRHQGEWYVHKDIYAHIMSVYKGSCGPHICTTRGGGGGDHADQLEGAEDLGGGGGGGGLCVRVHARVCVRARMCRGCDRGLG